MPREEEASPLLFFNHTPKGGGRGRSCGGADPKGGAGPCRDTAPMEEEGRVLAGLLTLVLARTTKGGGSGSR